MARKNGNAGQPNRQAQAARRTARINTSKQFHSQEHHRRKMVLGPLSEHLIATTKPRGELVEKVTFVVEYEAVAS